MQLSQATGDWPPQQLSKHNPLGQLRSFAVLHGGAGSPGLCLIGDLRWKANAMPSALTPLCASGYRNWFAWNTAYWWVPWAQLDFGGYIGMSKVSVTSQWKNLNCVAALPAAIIVISSVSISVVVAAEHNYNSNLSTLWKKMCSLQWRDPAVTDYLGSVVLLHAACFPHAWAFFFFFLLGRINKQKKACNKTSTNPETLNLYSGKHAIKAQLVSASVQRDWPQKGRSDFSP